MSDSASTAKLVFQGSLALNYYPPASATSTTSNRPSPAPSSSSSQAARLHATLRPSYSVLYQDGRLECYPGDPFSVGSPFEAAKPFHSLALCPSQHWSVAPLPANNGSYPFSLSAQQPQPPPSPLPSPSPLGLDFEALGEKALGPGCQPANKDRKSLKQLLGFKHKRPSKHSLSSPSSLLPPNSTSTHTLAPRADASSATSRPGSLHDSASLPTITTTAAQSSTPPASLIFAASSSIARKQWVAAFANIFNSSQDTVPDGDALSLRTRSDQLSCSLRCPPSLASFASAAQSTPSISSPGPHRAPFQQILNSTSLDLSSSQHSSRPNSPLGPRPNTALAQGDSRGTVPAWIKAVRIADEKKRQGHPAASLSSFSTDASTSASAAMAHSYSAPAHAAPVRQPVSALRMIGSSVVSTLKRAGSLTDAGLAAPTSQRVSEDDRTSLMSDGTGRADSMASDSASGRERRVWHLPGQRRQLSNVLAPAGRRQAPMQTFPESSSTSSLGSHRQPDSRSSEHSHSHSHSHSQSHSQHSHEFDDSQNAKQTFADWLASTSAQAACKLAHVQSQSGHPNGSRLRRAGSDSSSSAAAARPSEQSPATTMSMSEDDCARIGPPKTMGTMNSIMEEERCKWQSHHIVHPTELFGGLDDKDTFPRRSPGSRVVVATTMAAEEESQRQLGSGRTKPGIARKALLSPLPVQSLPVPPGRRRRRAHTQAGPPKTTDGVRPRMPTCQRNRVGSFGEPVEEGVRMKTGPKSSGSQGKTMKLGIEGEFGGESLEASETKDGRRWPWEGVRVQVEGQEQENEAVEIDQNVRGADKGKDQLLGAYGWSGADRGSGNGGNGGAGAQDGRRGSQITLRG